MEVVETQLLTNLNQKLLKYPFQHFHLLQWYIPLVKFQQVSRVILLNPPHSTVGVAFHLLFHIYVSQDIIIIFIVIIIIISPSYRMLTIIYHHTWL